ncbi:mitotic spindle checkpoint protein BUBR1 [Typha angustifolia]|uniref:mitotic spindle checkpoint protein BUBR1 n=1 Tax=Typha angustifolia TaxID=59011 RepID=UPI003C2BFE8D
MATEAVEVAEVNAAVDEEALFLASGVETGNEWELYKENVRPLKRGRNVSLLNHALKSHHNPALRSQLHLTRRRMIEAIDEYQGDDPLQPWLDCIKWVQESFPSGGDSAGLVVIYEQCVRKFWHDTCYKDDLRYLKVWLEYAANCADAEVIFSFLEANQIGQNHAIFYSSYSLYMEAKNKLRKADEIFNLGIARKAHPLEKLEEAYRTFLVRTTRTKQLNEDDSTTNQLPVRSFGTVLTEGETRRQPIETSNLTKQKVKQQRIDGNKPLSIYKEENFVASQYNDKVKSNDKIWHNLGTQSERNKENTSIPSKWVQYKVPQNLGARRGQTTPSTSIEIYVDEECSELTSDEVAKSPKPSLLKLRKASNQNLKKEAELLKENPLRNFPLNSLR